MLFRRERASDTEIAALEAGAHALDTIATELLHIAASRSLEDPELWRLAEGCAMHATVLRQMRDDRAHRNDSRI